MKNLLRLEELLMLLAALTGLYFLSLGLPWWAWLLLFFSPDISMIFYLLGTKAGAAAYNIAHHKAVAIIVAATGYFASIDALIAADY